MPTTDDPRQRAALLPTFRQPPRPSPDDPAAETPPEELPTPAPGETPGWVTRRMSQERSPLLGAGGGSDGRRSARSPRLDDEVPTPTSGTTKPSVATIAGLLAAVLGMAILGVSWYTRRAYGARLRRPDKAEAKAITTPLAKIILRHSDGLNLPEDLADVLEAGNAIGDYIDAGPMLLPVDEIDPGVPDDLNQEEP